MKNRITLILATLLLTWTAIFDLSSKQITLNPLPVLSQLPSNSVQRIFQDKDGYLWFGTLDGLCRYDAYRLTTFRSDLNNPNLLTNNNITCIAEDNNNNLWIGTKKGLNILDKRTYRITKFSDHTLENEEIKSILVSKDGSIWVGTGYSLFRYNADQSLQKRYNGLAKDGLIPNNSVNSIYEDSFGNIWVSVWSNGLFKYKPGSDSFLQFPKIGEYNNPFKIYQDDRKQYWICTWGDGLYRFNPNKNQESMYAKQPIVCRNKQTPDEAFYSIVQDDSNGYIWAMAFSGIYALEYKSDNNVQQVDISHMSRNSSNVFSEIVKDNKGNLWIGAFSEGVFSINFDKPDIYNHDLKGIRTKLGIVPHISIMQEDNDGAIWFNQNRIGLHVFYPKTDETKSYYDFPALKDEKQFRNTSCIQNSKRTGTVWIGLTDEPIVYVLNPSGQNVSIKEKINLDRIHPNIGKPTLLYEDSRDNMWIVTSNGVLVKPYNSDSIRLASANLRNITSISEDSQGSIWLSSSLYGLYKISFNYNSDLDNLQIKNYNKETHGLLSSNVQSVYGDKSNNVWIGTQEGNIIVYNGKTFEDYTQNSGMTGEAILDIIGDDYDHIWISTNKKITVYHPQSRASRDYTLSDGLLVNSFIKGSYYKNSDGKLCFGGNKGISVFTPTKTSEGQPKGLKTLITNVKIQNQSVIDGSDGNKYFDALTQRIDIFPGEKNIEIDFSTLNYTFPDKVQYAYKMEGVDDDWVYTGNQRQFATYNQLSAGTYTFYVKATDENRLWSDHVSKIIVHKHPAFYETWWAYLIYILLTAFVGYLAYKMIKNRLKLRNELKIAQIEKDKSEELTQTKLRYFTNISHDFLTPLTIISCLIDDVETISTKDVPQLNVMRTNVSRLKRLLQQVLDFRKVESGNMRLKVTSGDISAFIQNICYTHFLPLIKNKNIAFTFESLPELITAYFDADKIDKIIFNLLSNAFKYTPKNGQISVTLKLYETDNHQFIKIRIADSGVGIAPKDIDNIFTRFYNNKDISSNETNGIGLSLSRDLIELHHGTINVESTTGKGTCFTINIPIGKEMYDSSELNASSIILPEEEEATTTDNYEEETDSTKNAKKRDSTTILLVEDNEDLLYTIKNILSRQYNVLTATNGNAAIEIINNNDIDIVVSDVMMPEMDGLELCKKIKENIETSHISVLLLTAKNSVNDRIECYNAGAEGYISKPFELKVLEARINNLLTNKKHKQQKFQSNIEINIEALEFPSIDEQFLNKAVEIIEQNLAESDFDVISFAEHLNMSKSSLYRKLKTMTGLSPIEFIRNIKLKHGCILLKDRSISVSEAAYSVGFSDPKYFTACFKSEFGMTPSEYQKKQCQTSNT